MASKLFVVAALIAAVAAASPLSYGVVPVQRGVVAPAITYTASPTYAYTPPIARYSDAVETYSSAPVRTIVPPTVFATKTPLVAQAAVDTQYDPNPQYSYSYSVNDAETGDSKSHEESRNGDRVQGSYSVVESDGSIRRVDYTADGENGFNAVVHRQAGAAPPPPVPKPTPAVALKTVPEVTYQSVPEVTYKPAQAVALKSVPAVAYQTLPAYTYKSTPTVALRTVPEVTYQPAPEVTYRPAQAVALKSVPAVAYQTLPADTYKSAPAVGLRTVPEVTYQPAPEVTFKSAPAVTLKTIPEVAYQTVPTVRYAVPVSQQLVPSGSLLYSSVAPSVGKPSNVRTSFSAPFVNYEY